MASSTISNVPQGSQVVSDLLSSAVINSGLVVIEVDMSGEYKVYAILEEKRLKGSLVVGVSRGADVP